MVPVEVETYPTYVYAGTTWYLVDGRWYSRAGGRWVTYRREPVELGRYRASYYQSHASRRAPRVVERRQYREYRRY